MLVIGVNGRPGAGKTTVSKLLFNGNNTSIIHLDNLFDNVKMKCFSQDVKVLEKTDGSLEPYIDSSSNIGRVIRLKGLKIALYQAKKMYANFYLNSFIKNNFDRINYLIIEGRSLDIYKLEHFCDTKVFIDAYENKRYVRMLDRTVRGLTSADIKGIFEYDLKRNINLNGYYIIENNGDLDHLNNQVKTFEHMVSGKSPRVFKKMKSC